MGTTLLIARKDEERRVFLNAIGPVWDGNEVWLVIVVGGLFAGFPDAYATLLSSFYEISMIFLASLIFRAVAIEFRSKQEGKTWRKIWDVVFCLASTSIAFSSASSWETSSKGFLSTKTATLSAPSLTFFSPYTISSASWPSPSLRCTGESISS